MSRFVLFSATQGCLHTKFDFITSSGIRYGCDSPYAYDGMVIPQKTNFVYLGENLLQAFFEYINNFFKPETDKKGLLRAFDMLKGDLERKEVSCYPTKKRDIDLIYKYLTERLLSNPKN